METVEFRASTRHTRGANRPKKLGAQNSIDYYQEVVVCREFRVDLRGYAVFIMRKRKEG